MEKLHFKGEFNLLDYNISHRVLLIRNNNDSPESQGYNTDIIFESVFYLEIPNRFNDIILYEAEENTIRNIQEKIDYRNPNDFNDKIYVLESGEKQYYVGCWRFLIEENNLNALVSSIK